MTTILTRWMPVQVKNARMIEYLPDAALRLGFQRFSKTVILCICSLVVMLILCQIFPFLAENILYPFFRLLLAPIKPLLFAKPAASASGLVSLLATASTLANLTMIPAIVLLTISANKQSDFLFLDEQRLYWLKLASSQNVATASSIEVDGKTYIVHRSIEMSEIAGVSVERAKGKKSYADYVISIAPDFGEALSLKWGDIVDVKDRGTLFQYLEEHYPENLDLSILEPFRIASPRQSYTELWLRELSGAPKRDKLTPLLEGATLEQGNFKILSKVGVGGQATVYLAESQKYPDNNPLVLKEFVLPVFPDIRVRKKAAERFQSEASMLSKLDHPRIAKFLDLFVEDHRAYLVIEHIEGASLKERVALEGPMPEEQVVQLALQICDILKYLHQQVPPVIHRDLTPDNIMLGLDGYAKLIDFSVAQEVSSGVTGSVVGKPNYISPEQFRGKPTIQSDIYSFGATLYYLLVGTDPPPITVLHPKGMSEKVGDRLDAIVAKATQLDVSKRYASAEQVIADLKSIC